MTDKQDKQLKDEILKEAEDYVYCDSDYPVSYDVIKSFIEKSFKAGQDAQRKKDLDEIRDFIIDNKMQWILTSDDKWEFDYDRFEEDWKKLEDKA